MPVISNTSPILNLAQIGLLSLLQEQFGEVLIPSVVFDELKIGEDLPGCQQIQKEMDAGWLRVEKVRDSKTASILQRDLDKGEAEAIALSLELKAEWILLDERDARKIAKSLGLRVTGVLGILLKAWRQGKLPSLRNELVKLKEKAGFYIGDDMFNKILKVSRDITDVPNLHRQ